MRDCHGHEAVCMTGTILIRPHVLCVCVCVADYAYVAKDLCKLACAMNNKLAARVVFLKRCLSLFRGLGDNEWSAYATRMSQFLLLGCTNQRRSTV